MAILKRISFTDGFSSEVTPSETIVSSSAFLVGEGVPSDVDDGKDTDYYLDSTTGSIYLKTDGEWELYGSLETTPALEAHKSDTTDAHAASAITNTPSGNIAATDVQTALNELQTDIDSRALNSALTDHISDTTDAHDASAISNVASGNLVATDVQAALNELQTDIDSRALSSALTDHETDTSTHGVTTVAGISETQVFTNKDIDGGTASNTSRITLPKADKAVLDALTRKEGTIVYDSTGNKAYVDNGSLLVEVGSGSGGAFNYISNTGAESDTTGWTRYANTSASAKPDDFGGSANVDTTFTRSTSSPLNGDASFLLTKDAANRQGEGVYYEFTAENGHKTLKLLLSMLADTSNANITDSDLAIYLVGSSDNFASDFLVIEPNNPSILAGVPQIFKQLQLNADKTKYRLCIHIASTNATAYTAKFDDITFGPSSIATGSMISDWKSFTPTMTNLTVGNGTVSAFYKRSGDSVSITYNIQFGSTTSISSGISLAMPAGLAMDATKVPSATSVHTNNSVTLLDSDNSANRQQGAIRLVAGSNVIQIMSSTEAQVSTTVPFTWATSDRIMFTVTDIPITGWSSNTASSEDLGGREIRVRGSQNAGTALTANTTNIDWTEVEDTVSCWNGTTFTTPETGDYFVEGSVIVDVASTGRISAYIDGTISTALSNDNSTRTKKITGKFYLTKGQALTFRSNAADTLTASNIGHYISITKVSSPKTILETETVAAFYTSNSGQAIGSSNTTLKFEDITYDTHNAYNISTGDYTVPTSGKYLISVKYATASVAWSSGDSANSIIRVNAVEKSLALNRIHAVTTTIQAPSNIVVLDLVKGDVVTVTGANTQSAAMSTGTTSNSFSIARIK